MILIILKIRLIQAFRVLKEIGLLRILFLIAFMAYIIKHARNSYVVTIITGIILLSIHASRKDKRFLKLIFNRSYLIFFVEYFTLVCPIIVVFCFFKDWENIIVICLFCVLIPRIYLNLGLGNVSSLVKILLNPFSSNLNFKLNIKIPINNPRLFEWISGFRRYFIIIVSIYLLFLAFSFKEYVAPIGLVILSIIVSGFYYFGESREFVELFSRNYKTFLVQKIILSVRYLLVLFMPIVFISLIFQPGTWYYIIGAIIIATLIQIITIVFKYALFAENMDLGRNGIIVSINVICILMPFLWPLPIIMGIKYYFKAQNNLKIYLNDINSKPES
jgi:hypothetical protein